MNHTLARYCESVLKATKHSLEKAKNRPIATPKLLNRSSQKLACVITSLTIVAIGSWVSAAQIRDFALPLG